MSADPSPSKAPPGGGGGGQQQQQPQPPQPPQRQQPQHDDGGGGGEGERIVLKLQSSQGTLSMRVALHDPLSKLFQAYADAAVKKVGAGHGGGGPHRLRVA